MEYFKWYKMGTKPIAPPPLWSPGEKSGGEVPRLQKNAPSLLSYFRALYGSCLPPPPFKANPSPPGLAAQPGGGGGGP